MDGFGQAWEALQALTATGFQLADWQPGEEVDTDALVAEFVEHAGAFLVKLGVNDG